VWQRLPRERELRVRGSRHRVRREARGRTGGVRSAGGTWDGTSWSHLRVIGASSPHVAVEPNAVFIPGLAQTVLLR